MTYISIIKTFIINLWNTKKAIKKKTLIPFIVLSSIVLVTGVVLASVLPTTCKKADKIQNYSFNTQDFVNFDEIYDNLLYPINVQRDYTDTTLWTNTKSDEQMLSDFTNIIDENYGFETLFVCTIFESCHNFFPWDFYEQQNIYHFNELTAKLDISIHLSGSFLEYFDVNFNGSFWYYQYDDLSNAAYYEYKLTLKLYTTTGKGFNFTQLNYLYGTNTKNSIVVRFDSENPVDVYILSKVSILNIIDGISNNNIAPESYIRVQLDYANIYFPNIKFVTSTSP